MNEIFDYDDVPHCRIVGTIEAPNGLGYVEAFVRENKLPGGVNKATVVTPLEVTAHEADQTELREREMPDVDRDRQQGDARALPMRAARTSSSTRP